MKKVGLNWVLIALITLIHIVSCTGTMFGQVVRKGNAFIEQQNDSSSRGGATKTQYTYTDSKGVTDTVYISSKGSAFIWKTSKKTGKKYRKYLPKVTEQLGTKKSEKK